MARVIPDEALVQMWSMIGICAFILIVFLLLISAAQGEDDDGPRGGGFVE